MSTNRTATMDSEQFLLHYPAKDTNAYKGQNGRVLIIGGSYGMAGAVCLNLLGAVTAGADYICCALDSTIYPIAAGRFLNAVFYPLEAENWKERIKDALTKASAVVYGSGVNHLSYKEELLRFLLKECEVPLLLDAEALRMLAAEKDLLCKQEGTRILTPHAGEFQALSGRKAETEKERIACAVSFAEKYGVILVLKGPHTIIAAPDGRFSVNTSGNPALAQAGSGDVLSGMIAGLLPVTEDPFLATRMGVWLHGHLADRGLEKHSVHVFPLESFPGLMNDFLHENNRQN